MSKRTMYTLYEDKSALFLATVRRATQLYTIARSEVEALVDADLRATLVRIGQLRIANLARPVVVKLQRLLVSQSYRFPDLYSDSFEEGASPTIDYLVDLFTRETAEGRVVVTDPRRTAIAFLGLVVGTPGRVLVSGKRLDENEVAERVTFAVDLFLSGVQPR